MRLKERVRDLEVRLALEEMSTTCINQQRDRINAICDYLGIETILVTRPNHYQYKVVKKDKERLD